MKAKFLTDRGLIRDYNEDSGGIFFNQEKQLLAIIADGMGGHRAGDVASEMAVNIIKNRWEETQSIATPEKAELWIANSLSEVNNSIFEHSSNSEQYQGMGTTAVLVICTKDFITIGHIGDSRCYLRNNNGFQQITEDHSLVNELVRTGQITSEDAQHHPRKNIVLKALGTEKDIHADIKSLTWEDDNRLLLSSDGLTDKISNVELEEYINSQESSLQIGKKLIQIANERGGEDNISLIIIDYEDEEVGDTSC